MPTIDNRALVRVYVNTLCDGGFKDVRYRAGTLFINEDNELVYLRRGGNRTHQWGPATLAHWNRNTRLFVLNGDGLTDRHATGWQTQVRQAVQSAIDIEQGRDTERRFRNDIGSANGARYILVPFLALNAAGINMDTIQVVEMSQDGFELVWHPVGNWPTRPDDPPDPKKLPKGWTIAEDTSYRRVYETIENGQRWRLIAQAQNMYTHLTTGQKVNYLSSIERAKHAEWKLEPSWRWNPNPIAWGVPEHTPATWQAPIPHSNMQASNAREWIREGDEDHLDESLGWVERQHHLGSCVFNARGPDGKRHLYLSAFDEQERAQPMYYLAQLPDQVKTKVKTYGEAIEALAPPLVHKARADGVPVYRQGDVFAIETNLTDEQVYTNCRSRVRHEIAMLDENQQLLVQVVRGVRELPQPAPGEVFERVTCPVCQNHKRKIGNGNKAKRALSIYRTGHTATEVVVGANGTTYIRGVLHHDPQVEERGRRREHQNVQLGEAAKWHVALRNTVPRQKVRREQPDT